MKKATAAVIAFAVSLGVCFASGEIVANLVLRVTKGNVIYVNEALNQTLNLRASQPNVSQYTASIPTNSAGTALVLGSVATNGYAWLQNCDTNNFIEVGVQVSGAFYPLICLKAGEANVIRLATNVTPYARANVAPVVLKSPIIDD